MRDLTFEARYRSRCGADCLEPIQPGDEIVMLDGSPVHADCSRDNGAVERLRPVCETCWLEKPCGCED